MFIEVTYANRESSEGQPYKILVNLDEVIEVSPAWCLRPERGTILLVTSNLKKIEVTETYNEIKRKIMKIKKENKKKKNRFELMDL